MDSSFDIIDLLPILLFALLFFGAKLATPFGTAFNTEGYLSKESGRYYRGLFAVIVLFHHLAQYTEKGMIFHKFYLVGYMAVAFFFFLSGYGLQKSFITKGDDYRNGYLSRRILPILLPYLFMTVIYWFAHLADGHLYSFSELISELRGGHPLVSHSWYIINILLFYFVFYILMSLFKGRYKIMIAGALCWNLLYTFFCIKLGFGEWWYNASHLLIVGMIWALYEKKITDVITKAYFFITPVIWIIFITLFLIKYYNVFDFPNFHIIIKFFIDFFFVIGILLLFLKIEIGNKVLGFLGDISFEIYISQGLPQQFLRGNHINIENDFLYAVCVIISTIAIAYLLHLLLTYVKNRIYSSTLSKSEAG